MEDETRKTDEDQKPNVLVIDKSTTCGIGCVKGQFLQRFANDKTYVVLYGAVGCFLSASFGYFAGTISTIEKRFKVPSRNTGIITVGSDISTMVSSIFLSYFCGQSHRPRWVAIGTYSSVAFSLLNTLPHFLYGPGEDALALTTSSGDNSSAHLYSENYNKRTLCQEDPTQCDNMDGSFTPQIILFFAQACGGLANSIYFTLGVAYLDDNIKKSKTPALISFSYFIRTLGPAIGYGLAYLSLSLYVAPTLKPVINNRDPRWLGAWWIGWLVLASMLFIIGTLIGLFPKVLPKTALRKLQKGEALEHAKLPPTFAGLVKTCKKLLLNPVLMFNHFSAVFYVFGFLPYWMFMPKYIEAIYRKSASTANLVTGMFGLVFAALGIGASGIVLSRYKPKARSLAVWNVSIGVLGALGSFAFSLLNCPGSSSGYISATGDLNLTMNCNANCNCDYVKYSPICANGETFISPCHAGCTGMSILSDTTVTYTNCSCISREFPQTATRGACEVVCNTQFVAFIIILCCIKFVGATGRATNFLIGIRSVEEKDKPISMGIGLLLLCVISFVPSPIFFGYIFDSTCLIWGKTCSGKGNCWLYNSDTLIYRLNIIAGSFIAIGAFFDFLVWIYCKDLKIFDEEVEMEKMDEGPT